MFWKNMRLFPTCFANFFISNFGYANGLGVTPFYNETKKQRLLKNQRRFLSFFVLVILNLSTCGFNFSILHNYRALINPATISAERLPIQL